MGAYNYYFLDIDGVFYYPNSGGGQTPAPAEYDTEEALETALPNYVSTLVNLPGSGTTSWIGPNWVEGYFYGITQDLDYLNTVIGYGQQQVAAIVELPYYGQYAYDFVVSAQQAADDNIALSHIASNIDFSTELNESTQQNVINGTYFAFYGGEYKLFVPDDIVSVGNIFQPFSRMRNFTVISGPFICSRTVLATRSARPSTR